MCTGGFECEFRKQVVIEMAISVPATVTTEQLQEVITSLNEDADFVLNMRLNYALAKGIDLSQVIFKGFNLLL